MLSTQNLYYSYKNGPEFTFPDMACQSGEILLVLGKSGIGKSTLLNLLGGLMKSEKGIIAIDGVDICGLSQSKMDQFRGTNIGIIFQRHHFISSLTVLENLILTQEIGGQEKDRKRCIALLDNLGIGSKHNASIKNLSEGEKQRVSIARAVVNKPKLILADEPTSALDDENCLKVVDLLKQQASEIGAALIVVTHDKRLKDIVENQVILS